MNWDAAGAVGEIIGAGAVVISLIYLATQIRTQIRESRLAAIAETTKSFRESISSLQDPVLAEVFRKGRDDYAALSETEQIQFVSFVQTVMRVWETAYYQHRDKRLEDNIYEGIVRQFSALLHFPGGKHVWEIRKRFFSREFQEHVDEIKPEPIAW